MMKHSVFDRSAGMRLSLLLAAAVPGAVLAQSATAPHTFLGAVDPAMSGAPAWFGLRLPGPVTAAMPATVSPQAAELPARPARFAPGPMDPQLGGAAVRKDVATIVGFSNDSRIAGDYLWGRVTGRVGYDRTVTWVADRLKTAGLRDAHLEQFRAGSINLPVAGEIRLIGAAAMGAGSADIVLRSAMVEGNGPVDGTLTAPLVYAGQGLEADLSGRDLRGKIAVIVATPDPSLYDAVPASRSSRAMAAGAAGVIEILTQPGNMQSFDRDRHGCGRGLCFTVGGEDGFFLQNALGAAAKTGTVVTAALIARSETITPLVDNVVATIPGQTARTVIIDAHADGWFGGADDNASGLAVMIALARHFATQPRPLRTLVFLASAGHHSAGANGVRAFRANHAADFVASADLIINIEHPAQSAMMRSYVDRQQTNFGSAMVAASGDLAKQVAVNNRAPYLIDSWRRGVACFGLDTQRMVDTAVPGDLGGFSDLTDVPQTQMIASGGVYHTSGDDLDLVTPEALERAARFYAFLIAEAANVDRAQLHGGAAPAASGCPRTP